jgi:hypothetical protein
MALFRSGTEPWVRGIGYYRSSGAMSLVALCDIRTKRQDPVALVMPRIWAIL